MHIETTNTKKTVMRTILWCVATAIVLFLFWPYIDTLFLAVATVYLFHGRYDKFAKKMNRTLSLILTYMCIILVTIIPLTVIGMITSNQTIKILEKSTANLEQNIETATEKLNNFIPGVGDKIYTFLITPNRRGINYWPNKTEVDLSLAELAVVYSLDQKYKGYPLVDALNASGADKDTILEPYDASIIDQQIALDKMKDSIPGMETKLKNTTEKVGYYLTAFFVYMFTTIYLFVSRRKLREFIIHISPLSSKDTRMYMNKFHLMFSSIVKGILLASIIQGLLTGMVFAMVGIKAFALIAIVSTLLYIMSIGSFFLALPFAIYMFMNGHILAGVFLLVSNFIIGFLDNILKARWLHGEVKMSTALLLIVTFSGIIIRGFKGIFYGPLLMSFALATYEMLSKRE